jgi:hypothetical protein
MTDDEYRSIVSDELRRLTHDNFFGLGVCEVLPGEPLSFPPAVLPPTDGGGVYVVQIMLLRRDHPPETKLATFYHEVGHLHYNWSRAQRASSSPREDEQFAYKYMFERLVADGRKLAVAFQLDRLERRLQGNLPPHYRQAIESLMQSPLWAEWKKFAAIDEHEASMEPGT